MLLLGPTGSGKTPLGRLLAARGLAGRRCVHFDLGERLRAVAVGDLRLPGLTDADVAFVRHVLDEGALLEDEHFHIAEAILRDFIAEADALIVLNGLPRHEGQAEDVARIVEVAEAIHLACPAETVLQRIAADTGGDRTDRCDDGLLAVRRKLEIFNRRIAPLLDYYRRRGTPVRDVPVGPTDTPEDVWRKLTDPA